jgi:hypothetical protein
MEQVLADLRVAGWRVAIHNDYRQDGVDMTFWLMTHPTGLYLKGEAETDIEALMQIAGQANVWRCDVTGNPVGTDTRMIGAPPCQCQGCRAAAEIERLQKQMPKAEQINSQWGLDSFRAEAAR